MVQLGNEATAREEPQAIAEGDGRMIKSPPRPTDRQLLDSYVRRGDASAFQDLVRRHGPAVHRVCLGVLKDVHEAEDAFQATFMVLARRAPEIGEPEALGGWLRGVAHRVSIRERRRSVKRRAVEKTTDGIAAMEPEAPSRQPEIELRELVGEELSRLPDEYRRPILLCYLDGLTHEQAANRLEWPVGTVKVRLVRGRRLLRERLDRRGVALGAALLVLLGSGRRAHARTGGLIEATVRKAAMESASRRSAIARKSPGVFQDVPGSERLGRLFRYPGLWAAALILALALGFSGPVARVLAGPPTPEVDPLTVPKNLADVLTVECR